MARKKASAGYLPEFDYAAITTRLSERLSMEGDLRAAFRDAIETIKGWTGLPFAALWEADHSCKELHILYADSLDEHLTLRSWLSIGDYVHSGIAGRVASSKRTISYFDYDPDRNTDQAPTPYHHMKRELPIRTILAFPLLSHGEIAGVFELLDSEPRSLPNEVVEMLSSLVRHWGDIIRSHHSQQTLDTRRYMMQNLYASRSKCLTDAQNKGVQVPSIQDYTHAVATGLRHALAARACFVLKFRRNSSGLLNIAQSLGPEVRNILDSEMTVGPRSVFSFCAEKRIPVRLVDLKDQDELARRGLHNLLWPESLWNLCESYSAISPLLLVPLVSGSDELYGFFLLLGREGDRRFVLDDETLLLDLGRMLADQTHEWQEHEDIMTITNAVRRISPAFDLDNALSSALDVVRAIFGADWAYIMERRQQLGERSLICLASAGRSKDNIPELRVLDVISRDTPALGVNAYVFANERSLLVPDVSIDPLYVAFAEGPQAGSELCVPLVIGAPGQHDHEVMGTVCVSSHRTQAFSFAQSTLLWVLGSQLAYVLRANRVYHSIADVELQQLKAYYHKAAYDLAALYIHDFYSFLTGLRANLTSVAGTKNLALEVRSTIESQITAAEHETDQIRRVRQLIIAGGEPAKDHVSLKNLIKVTEGIVRSQLGKDKPINVIKNDLTDADLYVDEQHVKMIFTNILKNAWQVSLPNSHIWIESEVVDRMMCVRIRDEGPGFPNSLVNQGIKERVESSKRGSGIGLWLCQSLARLNGGWIVLENDVRGKKGAIVRVFLPLASRNMEEQNGRE